MRYLDTIFIWDEEQEQKPRVGDEVIFDQGEYRGVVFKIDADIVYILIDKCIRSAYLLKSFYQDGSRWRLKNAIW